MATFLFTDIEGSTQLWERHGDLMRQALVWHDETITDSLKKHGSTLIKHTGDGVFAVFEEGQPLYAVLDIQQRFASHEWGPCGPIHVRIGLHFGTAEMRNGDYFGPAVNRAARVMAVAWGGQILVTPSARDANTLPPQTQLVDLGTHLLKDLSEPQQIFGLLHPDLPNEFPPLKSLSARPTNLSQQTTPFVGRYEELSHIRALLTGSDCRLVTVLGPGGMGKTRLGVQAAADHIDIFPNGVFFVPLSPLTSPTSIPSAVADALGFTFQQATDQTQQLIEYLEHRKLLLVMDNFEHVISGAGMVADVLSRTPDVRVLVTSRERLNLQSECLLELKGLDVPPAADATVFEDFEAVEMFLAYAQRTQPDFHLSDSDKQAVTRICRLVGGMPLGIEMAASWIRSLPPAEIAAELEADLDFLATSMRDVPERHRSMRAVFQYSWNLLSDEEREGFAKLSVFRGGFTRDAAARVAGLNIQGLAALVDKSLIQRDAGGRYQIHELLRQYAEEKLNETGQVEALRDKHEAYYASLIADMEADILGKRQLEGQLEFSRIVAADLENIRVMWRRAVERQHVEVLAKILLSFTFVCQFQSRYLEGADVSRQMVNSMSGLPKEGLAVDTLARALVSLAWFDIRLGLFDEARSSIEQGEGLFEAFHLKTNGQFGLHPLLPKTILEIVTGHYDDAVRNGERIYQISIDEGDKNAQTNAAYGLIGAHASAGNLEKAMHYGQNAIRVIRGLGNDWFLAYCLNETGQVAVALGKLDEAKRYYEESHRIRKAFSDPEGMAVALNHLGEIALWQQDYAGARRLYTENLATYEEIGDRGGLAHTLHGLGKALVGLEDYPAARRTLRRALEVATSIQFVPLILSLFVTLGELFLKTGQRERGIELLACVSGHSSSDHWAREYADQVAARYQVNISGGSVGEFERLVESLLADLPTPEETL